MPQYVILASHDASQCPGANKTMRDVLQKLMPQLETIGGKHGIKRVTPMLHLDPSHQLMVLLEGPSLDAVLDSLIENRMGQTQNVQVFRATPVEDLFKMADTLGQQPLY